MWRCVEHHTQLLPPGCIPSSEKLKYEVMRILESVQKIILGREKTRSLAS